MPAVIFRQMSGFGIAQLPSAVAVISSPRPSEVVTKTIPVLSQNITQIRNLQQANKETQQEHENFIHNLYKRLVDSNTSSSVQDYTIVLDAPTAKQADVAEKAEDANSAHGPFNGSWERIRKMCRSLCLSGIRDIVPIYQHRQSNGENGNNSYVLIYCQNCEAHAHVLNSTSESSDLTQPLLI